MQPDYARVFHRNDVVSVTFWGAHPKNVFGKKSFRFLDQFPSTPVPTFLYVQRDTGGGNWQTIRTDADWDTTYQWERYEGASSKVTVTWSVGSDVANGTYRIGHAGVSINAGNLTGYTGVSPTFTISD